jgi:hypothetical protein
MKKAICILAVATISFGSLDSFAAAPVQTQQNSTKKQTKKKKMDKKKMEKDSTMKKDSTKM